MDDVDQLIDSFQNDIRTIRKHLPTQIQTLVLSENYIDLELDQMMYKPIRLTPKREDPILLAVKQYVFVMPFDIKKKANEMSAKAGAMEAIYSSVSFKQCMVFSNSQSQAESFCESMVQKGNYIQLLTYVQFYI